ncbi:uncharacterized protein LOC134709697 [Mytilus trossulus]|uniref:uncharacterized protein LOC134709697 n=1 Tax=Mytilus trossulus TaxID=6551 RepID=UPI0030064D2F
MVKLEMIAIFCVVVVLQMLNAIEGTESHHYWYTIDKCTCPYAEKNRKGIQWTWRVKIKDREVFPHTPVHGYHSMRVTLIEACKNQPKTYMGYAKVHMARECFDRFHFKEDETYLLSGYQKHINGIDRWIIDYCSPNRVESYPQSCNYPHQKHYCGYNCGAKC